MAWCIFIGLQNALSELKLWLPETALWVSVGKWGNQGNLRILFKFNKTRTHNLQSNREPRALFHYICIRAFLTVHNWQKWKRVFLTCPCNEIYRDEAVGLKSCKYTWQITIYVIHMWNLGQFRENLIFCQ